MLQIKLIIIMSKSLTLRVRNPWITISTSLCCASQPSLQLQLLTECLHADHVTVKSPTWCNSRKLECTCPPHLMQWHISLLAPLPPFPVPFGEVLLTVWICLYGCLESFLLGTHQLLLYRTRQISCLSLPILAKCVASRANNVFVFGPLASVHRIILDVLNSGSLDVLTVSNSEQEPWSDA